MRNQLSAILIALCVALGVQQTALAQGTNTSTFGSVNANRSFTSDNSFSNNRSFGGTASAGSGSALGNLGGQQLDLGQEMESTGRMLFSANQFQVGNRQAGQFVGTSLFDPRMFIGATTSGGQSGTALLGGRAPQRRTLPGAGGAAGATPGLGGQGQGAAKSIRVTARLAFEPPKIDSRRVSASLVRRFQQPGQIQIRLPVEVTVDGRTATLRGQVATEYDRILAERFVRMEPGISQVINELVVARAPTPAQTN